MDYQIKQWSIKELIDLYASGQLKLDPPYQRNFIWSRKDQNELINSIVKRKFPLPTFFIREVEENSFEMVDGQQRTRTILSYYRKNLKDALIEEEKLSFESYQLSITLITNIDDSESIEDFYSRVNKTGLKLNKPELNKAEYFYTKFLELNEELSNNPEFKSLNLFTDASRKRMNDIDFVSELVALLEFGNFEKKSKVDDLYENDISEAKADEFKDRFLKIIDILSGLNQIFPINKSRYRQRNDFYTLFGFISKHHNLSNSQLQYFFKILILISSDISPSNNFCRPFKEYAQNCVSQSNQKRVRNERSSFFDQLLLNQTKYPNEVQKEILNYYEIDQKDGIEEVDGFWTISLDQLSKLKQSVAFDGQN